MKKVFFWVSSSQVGGGEKYALSLAKSFIHNSEFEIFLSCPSDGSFSAQVRKEVDADHFIPFSFSDIPNPVETFRFVKKVREIAPHIIHSHLNRASLYAGLLSCILPAKIVSTVHGINRAIYYNKADRIIAVSQKGAQHLIDQDVPEKQVTVILNGINTNHFFSIKPPHGSKRANNICCVGRLHPNKGQFNLILAISLLRTQKKEFTLHLVGSGPQRAALEDLVKKESLENSVIFHGLQEDIRPVLNICDQITLPSLSESLPLSILEGMAMGLKVSCTEVGDTPNIVHDSFARVMKDNQPETISQAIVELQSLPPAPLTLPQEIIMKKFNWERVLLQNRVAYEKLLRN